MLKLRICVFTLLTMLPLLSHATGLSNTHQDLTQHWVGYTSLILFIVAYLLVIGEEFLHLRKSKPVIIAAGIIWVLIGIAYINIGDHETTAIAIRHNPLDYSELLLFLLAAMTYINTMEERQVFNALRAWLVSRDFSLRNIFWLTGLLAFCISPIMVSCYASGDSVPLVI